MVWPWKRETRSSANYSEVVQDALLALAEGKAAASALTTGAVEACAGLQARCFAQAIVTPAGAISPSTLYDLGRDLALRGEFVALLEVGTDGPTFVRPSSWTVRGGHLEASWTYDLWLSGPSSATRMQVRRDRVLHVRINAEATTPWQGRSPISAARSTGRLLAELESSLGDEGSLPVGRLVPSPEGEHKLGSLQKAINSLRGKLVFTPTTAGGYGDKGAAPMTDWKPTRVGPDFTAAEVSLREMVERSVCGIFSVHPGLISSNIDGSAMREAFRKYLRANLEGLVRVAVPEFARVLGEPDLQLSLSRLRASDTAGQARAFRGLAGKEATIDTERALYLAGLTS